MAERKPRTVDQQIDHLYGLPLGEFTAERNRLAKELRGRGERDAAEAVGRLRKPSTPAWVVNQLVRHHPELLDDLIAARDKLAQSPSGEQLLDAGQAERDAMRELRGRAQGLAGELRISPAALDRVEETLHAAVVDEDARRDVRAGRLTEPRQAVGFDALQGLTPARPASRPAPRKPPSERQDRVRRQAREALERARDEVDRTRDALEAADERRAAALAAAAEAGVPRRELAKLSGLPGAEVRRQLDER